MSGTHTSDDYGAVEKIETNDESRIGQWLLRERSRNRLNRMLTERVGIEPPKLDGMELEIKDEILRGARPFDLKLLNPFSPAGRPWTAARPDLLHIYGAAGAGVTTPAPDTHYAYVWSSGDPPFGVSGTVVREGKFHAGQYTTSGYVQALAGVGVRLQPSSPWCRLSIRPYVRFDGSSALSGRTFAVPGPPAWASAYGSVGIYVESWAQTGGAHHVDEDHYVVLWDHNGPNPRSGRSYEDTISSSGGLRAEVFASGQRRYRIWVYCWAEAVGQSLTQATAYAGSSISCWMPLLVVEELPA